MVGKQSRKLFKRRVTARDTVEGIKSVDGRDDQIADVRGGNLDDDAIRRRVISAGAVGFDEVGPREIGGNRLYVNGVVAEHIAPAEIRNYHVGPSQIGGYHIGDGEVGPDELDRDYLTPGEGDDRYAKRSHSHDFPSKTGSADGSVGSHSHSISSTTFIKQPRSERMRMLNDRLDLEELLYSGHLHPEDAIVARNTLNLLTLLMDYHSLNAFQRERAFVDPACSEWSDMYKQVYGVDEYAEDDRENFLSYTLGEGEDHTHVRQDPYTGIAPSGASEAQSPKDPGK